MILVADYLASLAEQHKVFAFYGPMGAGKTTLIGKTIRILIGQELNVTSPTFALVNVYESKKP
ncbi:MAG: tRNA (adenosine(37)-N6)-threonylcarbamoyltransferase complex ATPase subunit type 1 TsaE, partial [Bacteroidales bacterium]|nr:tRNA (adenosine(37)-N6)-threonylcarbamoyltransferase complex ATPase subunit type 1 TsaE [Bacteroidales bacterium]